MAEINPLGYAKKNPLLVVGGVVIGGLLLYAYWNSGNNSGGAVVQQGFDPAAANYDLQMQSLAAGLQQANLEANFGIRKIQEEGASALALAKENNSATLAAQAGQVDYQKFALGQQADLARFQIANDTSVASQRINAEVLQAQANRDVQIQQLNTLSQTQIDLARIGADVNIAGINAISGVQRAQIQANKQTSLFGGLFGLARAVIA